MLPENIKALTGLRFIAAFYIFLFHIDMPYRNPLTYLHPRVEVLIQQGRLGVTLFFVLSGFILTYSHLHSFTFTKPEGFRSIFPFLYKRLARIYPVYLTGLLLCLGISAYYKSLPELKIIVLSATFLLSYFPGLAMQWYDGAAWSVGNEVFFYLMFPFAFVLLRSFNHKVLLLILLAIFIILGSIIRILTTGYLPRPYPAIFDWFYCFPPTRFPEFLTGVVAALLVFKFNWKIPVWVSLFLLAISAFFLSTTPPPMVHNWLILPTFVALLAVLAQPEQSFIFKWLGSKPMQYLGQISYSFYIIQIPLTFILINLIIEKKLNQADWKIAPIAFLINLAGAILLYEVIEKNAHSFLMRLYRKNKKPLFHTENR
jgi:peptidoglycan/LPS O-acetylase OafA/YrhL